MRLSCVAAALVALVTASSAANLTVPGQVNASVQSTSSSYFNVTSNACVGQCVPQRVPAEHCTWWFHSRTAPLEGALSTAPDRRLPLSPRQVLAPRAFRHQPCGQRRELAASSGCAACVAVATGRASGEQQTAAPRHCACAAAVQRHAVRRADRRGRCVRLVDCGAQRKPRVWNPLLTQHTTPTQACSTPSPTSV